MPCANKILSLKYSISLYGGDTLQMWNRKWEKLILFAFSWEYDTNIPTKEWTIQQDSPDGIAIFW